MKGDLHYRREGNWDNYKTALFSLLRNVSRVHKVHSIVASTEHGQGVGDGVRCLGMS